MDRTSVESVGAKSMHTYYSESRATFLPRLSKEVKSSQESVAATSKSIFRYQMWDSISKYAAWCVGGAALAGLAQAACACAGARARRVLHERLLHAALHAPLHYHHASPIGAPLHRFSADVQVIDKVPHSPS